MKQYKLLLNEEQLRVIKDACELRFRIDLMQEYELAEILASIDTDFDKSNPEFSRIFDAYIDRKDHIRTILKAVFEIASPNWKIRHKRNPDSLVCEDLWQVIKYQFYKDSEGSKDRISIKANKPMQVSKQPLPTLTLIKKGETK